MYTEILRDIDGVAIFPVISLVVFVLVFSVMLIRTARLDRQSLDRLAQLPLERPSRDSESIQ
jgi:cytochrome c oxidase cbb3-type subunit IV